MKKLILVTSIFLVSLQVTAQSYKVKDLSNSIGNWDGKLTYLDYSTGKPFTMLANIKISLTQDGMGYIMGYEYPKEPHANSTDTTYIKDNQFGKDKIVAFEPDVNGGFKMITEVAGEDGNEHKKATLRHIYTLKSNTYSIIKEVMFEGTNAWIKRNEYSLNKVNY